MNKIHKVTIINKILSKKFFLSNLVIKVLILFVFINFLWIISANWRFQINIAPEQAFRWTDTPWYITNPYPNSQVCFGLWDSTAHYLDKLTQMSKKGMLWIISNPEWFFFELVVLGSHLAVMFATIGWTESITKFYTFLYCTMWPIYRWGEMFAVMFGKYVH